MALQVVSSLENILILGWVLLPKELTIMVSQAKITEMMMTPWT